jgi:hypothetical protein
MRTECQKRKREQGSVLVLTIILGAILLVTMASYLRLVSVQEISVNRSQDWNAALTVTEAGVEEALAQINASSGDFSANGWGGSGGTYGPMSRALLGGSYNVAVTTNSVLTIYSTGLVTVPITGSVISRAVKVTAQSLPLINVALGAVYNIDMNGNSIATDSWNSHMANLSNNGLFDPSKVSTNGSIASVQGFVDIGNHTIEGNLYLGPSASFGGSGTIDGAIYNDYNVQFPDVILPTPPSGWGFPPSSGSGGSLTHDFTSIYSGGYYDVSDSGKIIVEPGVTVTLKISTTSFSPSTLTILGGMTNSGTLKMYQVSGTATMSGNAALQVSRPENFYYYGLPGVTAITLGGTTTFIGVIYAPEAVLTLNGGGAALNLEGAAIVKSVQMNGHYQFHYDESLAASGPIRGFVPTSWQEL